MIKQRASERELNMSDFLRKAALEYCGVKTNPLPESVEKWASGIRRKKLIEILGAEPGALERIKEFFGRAH